MLALLQHPAATAFGHTLLHTLWQAILVAGLVALLHTQLTAARHRYATALGGLLLLPVLAVATFYHYYTPLTPGMAVDASQWRLLLETAGSDATGNAAPTTDWRSWLPYLTGIYLVGLCFFALRLAGAGLRIHFLRRRGIYPVDEVWQARMTQLNHRYGIRPPAKLYLSERVDQVLSFGHFKPLILFPLGLLNHLTPAEVEAILLHELAHLQRRDYLWNWLQSAVETAYFFHPAVYWLGRRIRHERECCCDDWVAQRTDKTIYAQSLIHLARFAQTPTNQLAMYANSTRSPLGQRIERLFQPATRRRSVLPLLLLLIPFVLLAWQPLRESAPNDPTAETRTAGDDRPAERGAETIDWDSPAPEPAAFRTVSPAEPDSRQRTAATVYTLAPRELARLQVGDEQWQSKLYAGFFRSVPTVIAPVGTAATLPPAAPAADTIPPWSGSFDPQTLFIIDGKRLPRGAADPLEQLDPEDIIRIDVHKGASAVEKFGNGSEQGVIVVTTRRGNEPRSREAGAPTDGEQKAAPPMRAPAGQQPEPRYVIDGVMLPAGQPLDVQPNHIESITVWKGEKATERFGAAGENGVVDIKTKTGTQPRTPATDAPIRLDADEQQTKIRIRPAEQQQPLYVIDGEVQPKGANVPAELTPEDIESVEVLKGAAATERFGDDAPHGAVLIQTKKAANQKGKARPQKEKLRFGPGITIGDPNPLYVIDGEVQPDARQVEKLDMDDIELINIRKNESARAIYGESIGDRSVIDIRLKKVPAPAPQPRPSVPQPTPQPDRAPTAVPQPALAPQPMDAPQYLTGTLFPNPTSGTTQVRFTLDREEQVVLDIFNAEGRRVLNQQYGRRPAGKQQLEFDTTGLPAGTYTVTILAGGQRWKATLVRP